MNFHDDIFIGLNTFKIIKNNKEKKQYLWQIMQIYKNIFGEIVDFLYK